MEELRADDLRLLGPYVLLAALTPAGGEPRLLARRSAGDGLAEITLVRGEGLQASTAALRATAGPGLPELLEDGSAARPPWLAWRFVPALTLAEAGALMYGGLPRATLRALGARLAVPLARLHAHGTTHGALTPDAVLVAPDGPRLMRPRRTGTPQDDIAALGAVLTHAGAGRAPDDPLLRRCSHEDPEQRPTAEELVQELQEEPFELPARLVGALAREADRALALESATDAPPPAGAARTTRRTLLTAAGAGLLLGAGGVAGWVAGRGGTEALTSPASSTRRTTPRAAAVRGTAPAVLWRYDAEDPRLTERNSSLAHSSGRVHLLEYPELTALSLADGRPVWRTGGLGSLDRVEAAEPGTLILHRGDRFQAVSAEDGSQLWTEPIDLRGLTFGQFIGYERKYGLLHYSAIGAEGSVPGATGRTYLISFDVRRRTEAWRLPVPADKAGEFVPVFDEKDALYVLYAAGGALNLVEVDRRTGRAGRPFRHTWRPANRKVGVSSVGPRQIYTFGEGRIEAAPLRENKPLWRLDLSSDPVSGEPPAVNTPSLAKVPGLGTVLYTSDTTRTVYAIDPVRGRELWRRTLLPDPPSPGILDGPVAPGLSMPTSARTLLAYGRSAGVVALDPRTGAVKWTFQSNQSASSLYHAYIVDDLDLALIANGPSLFAFPAG
ncbi:PQQ-binding-like beta-propeller repeat protein [Streptomyces sp. NPDC051963]|uniref:outer membrane protein assembly factor BamB family protein n=1 Tax=Streptomyces sp. NPDC051963 TaxID=3365678 RepID=UPI0037D29B83